MHLFLFLTAGRSRWASLCLEMFSANDISWSRLEAEAFGLFGLWRLRTHVLRGGRSSISSRLGRPVVSWGCGLGLFSAAELGFVTKCPWYISPAATFQGKWDGVWCTITNIRSGRKWHFGDNIPFVKFKIKPARLEWSGEPPRQMLSVLLGIHLLNDLPSIPSSFVEYTGHPNGM